MIRRARLISVATTVACGALGVIASTQTWLTVLLDDGADQALEVPGADAIPVLAPLSLAVLALGAALSIVGPVLRHVFGALSVLIGLLLAWLTAQIVFGPPVAAVVSTVTTATGIAGERAVAELVLDIGATAWPAITLAGWVVLVAAGAFTLATARRWAGSGRRYRTDDRTALTGPSGARPHDAAGSSAIDDWDDLSRGEDPTA